MSVQSITDSTSVSQNWHSIRKSTSQEFQGLVSALQQGNLAGAQQAYASLQQVLPTSTSSGAGNTTSQSAASNTIINDWNALGQALQSGSTATAQSALTTLQQDASSVYATLQWGNNDATTAMQGSNTVQNDLNSLNQALQTGNTSAAQQILAQLQQDLQQSGMQPQTGTAGGHHHHHHGGDNDNQQQTANAITSLFASTNPTNTSSLSAQA